MKGSNAVAEKKAIEPFCVLFAGRFILALPDAKLAFPLDLVVEDRFGARQQIAVAAGHEVGTSSGDTLICLIVPLAELMRVSLNSGSLRITLLEGGAQRFSAILKAEPLNVDKAHELPVARTLLALVKAGFIDSRVGIVFDGAAAKITPEESSGYGIERAYQTPFGLLIDGWLTNVGRRDLVIASDDLVAMAPVEDFVISPRPDLKLRLTSDTVARATGQFHGFSASLPGCRETSWSIYILERLSYGTQLIGPIPFDPIKDRDEALRLACDRLMGMPEVDANAALAFLGPLVATPQISVKADVNQFGPDVAEPRLSVVVPITGAEVFLRSLIAQQRRLKLPVEWLLCAEAGVASRAALRLLSAHQDQLLQPVVLVEADVDATPTVLMNAGAKLARARSLLFLDETVWIERPQAIAKAIRELESGLHDAIGLMTLLDDGGLDHAGFAVQPDPHYRNLIALDPVGRGLPAAKLLRRSQAPRVHHVISAAGLCISREVFNQIGGFDDRMRNAEFAGADLSVRLRHMGGRISLSSESVFARGFDEALEGQDQSALASAFSLLDRFRLARSLSRIRSAASFVPSLTDGRSA